MEVPTAIIMGGRARSPAFGRLTGSKVTKMSELTHFDEAGQAHMVNVGEKSETHRIAVACGRIHMQPATFELVAGGTAKKGDSKRTSDLVPLCHPIGLTRVAVDFELDEKTHAVTCTARCECYGKTGVEMEALTAVQVGLLTIYDMCKAVDRGMVMTDIRLLEKDGGKSGRWTAERA